tara:strand:+ start:868 stop:1779 length:912 start_codon:yes stop_codon:yes gene_type:complete
MEIISQIENLKSKISGKISFNESLSKLSWFNLGGPAKILFRPQNIQELSLFLKAIRGMSEIKVLGAGSNTLIRDGGYDGVIIKLGQNFSHLSLLDSNTIIAGASVLDKKASDFALQNSLSGFEFLSCIPGSIGGAVRMNSGCYGEDISKILLSVQTIDFDGNIRVIEGTNIKFGYRESNLNKNLIFISASFKGKKDTETKIKKKIDNLVKTKINAQPSKIKTCGSTFKNPDNNKAWKLIKESGCVGMEVGGAKISEKHCNFFVNKGNAKSKDLEELIYLVKDKVLKKTGINLELEIQIIGKAL